MNSPEPKNPFQSPETVHVRESRPTRIVRRGVAVLLLSVAGFGVAAGSAATLAALGVTESDKEPFAAITAALLWAVVTPLATLLAILCWRRRVEDNATVSHTGMRAAFASRGLTTLAGAALVANVALLVVNVAWSVSTYSKARFFSRESARAAADAEHLGMEVAHVCEPLAVFVDKEFPRKNRYLIADYSGPALIEGEPADPDLQAQSTRSISLVLGEDFSVNCYYSAAGGIGVQEVSLSNSEASYMDFLADGVYDMRIVLPTEESPSVVQVWYEDEWWEAGPAAEAGKFNKVLHDGTQVHFDCQRAQWVATAEHAAELDPARP